MGGYSDFALRTLCGEIEELSGRQLSRDILDSAKFGALRGLLPALRADGHRVLIFSQLVEMLDLLEYLLGPTGLKLPFVRLDGSTPVAERQRMIDKFQAAG